MVGEAAVDHAVGIAMSGNSWALGAKDEQPLTATANATENGSRPGHPTRDQGDSDFCETIIFLRFKALLRDHFAGAK